jgi:thymidylate kinase
VTVRAGALIAVDGLNGAAMLAAARTAVAATFGARRGGLNAWDASGVFEDLAVADEAAGRPSARTLLLLYAADLAFRLRWGIRPALAEGRTVVAAPYVDTAVAFGRAAGLRADWLANLFQFAPRPTERRYVDMAPGRTFAGRCDFIGFGLEHMSGRVDLTRQQFLERARAHLRAAARRARWRGARP